jgi:hypothetical protein
LFNSTEVNAYDVVLVEVASGFDVFFDLYLDQTDTVLYVADRAHLFNLLLHLTDLVFIEIHFEVFAEEVFCVDLKLALDLEGQRYDLHVELGDHAVSNDVRVERKPDCFLRGVFISSFLEDFAVAVPPSAEALARVQNVAIELVELGAEFFLSGVEGHVGVAVVGGHLDQSPACPECLVASQGAHYHNGDGVQNPCFPVVVVGPHVLVTH